MGNIFIEGEDLLFKLILDDEVGRLDKFIEDGDFRGDGLVKADLLEYVADLLEILAVIDVVAVVEHPVREQVVYDEVVQQLVVFPSLVFRNSIDNQRNLALRVD